MREAAASHPEAETLRGRGRVYVVPAPVGRGRWVVRPYRRGGAIAPALGDRYLRLGTPRPFREFRVGRVLEELGVPTPAHIGAAVYAAGPWYRGDLVTRYIPDSEDLAAVLFPGRVLDPAADPTEAVERAASSPGVGGEEAMGAAGRLIRLLHDRGVKHPDLNLKNILIAGGAEVRALALDLDGARVEARLGERSRRRMLDRFWRSARKWEARTGIPLGPGLRSAFREGYGSGSGG